MNHSEHTILVAGATGRQGGAVARHLLNDGWKVRAITRDPEKPSAVALKAKGIEVVRGNLNDPSTLGAALQGVYGVFSVQTMMEEGVEAEERQGKALADAAKAAGVQHFVYSSVGGAERNTGIPHFESKWNIEKHVRALGLPYTILRPAMFMDMMDSGMAIMLLTFMNTLVSKPVQLIAVEDIGAFAALAFANREQYLGREIEIAGDALTAKEIARALRQIKGGVRPVLRLPKFVANRLPEEFSGMLHWFEKSGYQADIASLKRVHPQLRTFEGFLRGA